MTPAELRHSLYYPPNAVVDTGIDLRRKYPAWVPAKDAASVMRWRDAQDIADTVWNTRLRKMIGEIANVFGVPLIMLKGEKRTFPLVQYRQAAYCIMCRFSGYSINQISKGFNRHHTSVILGMRKMAPHMTAVAAELPADAPAIEWARAMKRKIDQ